MPVYYTERIPSGHNSTKVHITPCAHVGSGVTYTVNDDDTHHRFCSYCGDPADEPHTFAGGACTLCSLAGSENIDDGPHTVTFLRDGETIETCRVADG